MKYTLLTPLGYLLKRERLERRRELAKLMSKLPVGGIAELPVSEFATGKGRPINLLAMDKRRLVDGYPHVFEGKVFRAESCGEDLILRRTA